MVAETTESPRIAAHGPGLTCCARCPGAPCENLRFGGVRPGKFELVHHHSFDTNTIECPFYVSDWNMAKRELLALSCSGLHLLVSRLMGRLTPLERNRYDLRHFVQDYLDVQGRMGFLKILVENRIAAMIKVPELMGFGSGLEIWLRAFEGAPELRTAIKKDADTGAAVTDGMVATPDETKTKSEKRTIHIRLNVDPNDEKSFDDIFTLFSTDGAKSYRRSLTIRNDKVAGDDMLDLDFIDCPDDLSYTLEVDLGKEGRIYYPFEDTPFKELANG